MKINEYCARFYKWAKIMKSKGGKDAVAITAVDTLISKSCLLDRLIYGEETGPSETPCPVHKGEWAGIHGPWPGAVWIDAKGNRIPAVPDETCQKWYDQGCRCFQHKCGCTTGWQPDEHCGCIQSEVSEEK